VKIGFDAKRLFNNFTGLGNYSRFVVNALLDYAPGNEYLLYTPKRRDHPEVNAVTDRKEVSVITPSSLYTFFKAGSLWRTWGIAKERTALEIDVFHGLSNELPANLPQRIRKIVTVHDLIFLRYPMFYNPIDVRIYEAKVKAACRSADRVIAISRQTADDVISFLGISDSKIDVVYQGCHPQFKQAKSKEEIAKVKRQYNLPDQYMLNVGTIEIRKNVILAVQALGLLPPASRIPLVIMGRETTYKKSVITAARQAGVIDSIIFLHDAAFQDFPAIYQGAQLFVYPSLFEGFGIPLVEALESGIPAITSKGSCFREAAGPDSIYVDPSDVEEMALQMNRLLSRLEIRQQMISTGKRFIEKFSPSTIAAQLMSVYAPAK
jgi:glycosyltransferase involved in cell wall biosynthesis